MSAHVRQSAQSSALSRNPREVFDAAGREPLLITRRDGDPLVLMTAAQYERDRAGLQLAMVLVAAALDARNQSPTDRLRQAFPWLPLLSSADQQACAAEVLELARACADVGQFHPLVTAVAAWKGTAEAVAAGYPADSDLAWLD